MGLAGHRSASSRILSSSFSFLSITQLDLADRPQSIGSSLGLLFPSAQFGIGGPLSAGFACPLRSAFRVWLPSWRFAPNDPQPVIFRTGSAHGIHPSKLSPLERLPGGLALGETRVPFLLLMITLPKRDAGTAGRSFRVFTFRESLAATHSFSMATAGCSLGFRPLKARLRKP